eukprot:RCo029183
MIGCAAKPASWPPSLAWWWWSPHWPLQPPPWTGTAMCSHPQWPSLGATGYGSGRAPWRHGLKTAQFPSLRLRRWRLLAPWWATDSAPASAVPCAVGGFTAGLPRPRWTAWPPHRRATCPSPQCCARKAPALTPGVGSPGPVVRSAAELTFSLASLPYVPPSGGSVTNFWAFSELREPETPFILFPPLPRSETGRVERLSGPVFCAPLLPPKSVETFPVAVLFSPVLFPCAYALRSAETKLPSARSPHGRSFLPFPSLPLLQQRGLEGEPRSVRVLPKSTPPPPPPLSPPPLPPPTSLPPRQWPPLPLQIPLSLPIP